MPTAQKKSSTNSFFSFVLNGKNKSQRREAKKTSDAITRRLKADQAALEKEKAKVVKLLIIGAAESGKTTVLKQIKIIHGAGLNQDRLPYRRIVRLNVINAIKSLCQALVDCSLELDNPKNQPHFDYVQNNCSFKSPFLPNSFSSGLTKEEEEEEEKSSADFVDLAIRIKSLWEDATIKEVYRMGWAEDLQDSAEFFLNNVGRFVKPNYIPSDPDIIQARVMTSGITEHQFSLGEVTFKIYDVGGHSSQRKYWAPYFDDCNGIIFMAAISSFDQTLGEDRNENRMLDALALFESICNHKLLASTAIILFLNKVDVLKRKLEAGIKVSDHMPDYKGENTTESVTSYFQKRFLDLNKPPRQEIYVHLTHATDTLQMRVIVNAVQSIIQRTNIQSTGIIE